MSEPDYTRVETEDSTVAIPTRLYSLWFTALVFCVQVFVLLFFLFGHWWTALCFILGSVSELVFGTRASCSDEFVHYSDEIDACTGFVQRSSNLVLQSY